MLALDPIAWRYLGSVLGMGANTELALHSSSSDDTTCVCWLADDLWRLAARQAKDGASETTLTALAEEVRLILRSFLLVTVLDARKTSDRVLKFHPAESMRSRVCLVDARGTRCPPLAEEELSSPVRNLLAAVKAAAVERLGLLGRATALLLFPANNGNGEPFLSASTLTIAVGDRELTWKLPLSPLLGREEAKRALQRTADRPSLPGSPLSHLSS